MLDILHVVEAKLGDLLAETDAWRSKRIDYTPPLVDRLYRDWVHGGVNYRVNLHRVHPCDVAFYHPHPWPSAIRVLPVVGSSYEMAVGGGLDRPPVVALMRVGGGMEYEMVHPEGWHSVRVVGAPSISVMVTGPVWSVAAPRTDAFAFRELSAPEIEAIVGPIRAHYGI